LYDTGIGAFNGTNIGIVTTGGLSVGGNILTTTVDGNVGIGTISPAETLEVNGTLRIESNGTLGLYQSSEGRVGIGTASPEEFLVVSKANPDAATGLRIDNAEVGQTGQGTKLSFYQSATPVETGRINSSWDGALWQLILGTNADYNTMTLENGKVGIGTTDPDGDGPDNADNLVIKNSAGHAGMTILTSNTGVGTLRFGDTDSSDRGTVGYIHAASAADSSLYFNTGGTDRRMTIDGNGNVGIGDSSPDYGLDVVDDINSDDCFREAGAQVAGTCTSDIRLKKNIKPLQGSLDKILELEPVEFEWKEGIDELGGTIRYVEGRQVGLVAQDVEPVLPHLVHERNGYLSVEYNLEMQMMLVNAIQELKEENQELKQLICLDHPEEEICQ
jgi:hypothetical protein